MITATFTRANYDSSKRLIKDRWTYTEVIETLTPIEIEYNRIKKTFYLRESELAEYAESRRSNMRLYLYNIDGSTAYGTWQHGAQGEKMHSEPIFIWAQDRKLIARTTYQNGRKKDSFKYLLSIEAAK